MSITRVPRCTVTAWFSAADQEGVLAFYSTNWSNEASVALANSLRLKRFAVEFSVD